MEIGLTVDVGTLRESPVRLSPASGSEPPTAQAPASSSEPPASPASESGSEALAKSCLNASCGCPPAAEGDFCCDACYAADRANPRGGACACGHDACGGRRTS